LEDLQDSIKKLEEEEMIPKAEINKDAYNLIMEKRKDNAELEELLREFLA